MGTHWENATLIDQSKFCPTSSPAQKNWKTAFPRKIMMNATSMDAGVLSIMDRVTGAMSTTLLTTKLHSPQSRTKLIARSRLLERLRTLQSPSRRLGLISAPAGFGKTTLVVQWLAGDPSWPVGWVSLDARDNQPAAFFAYFIAALQTIAPEVGKNALELLPLPGLNLEEVITLLANDLTGIFSPFVMILDDFHNITNPLIHQAIDLLLDAQPPQMRLLLLTREDPPLRLALRRANDQLVELRQEDLRFGLTEALDFLDQCMGLTLIADQVEILEDRTEGWVAGLQLAALSLQHSPDVDGFIHKFSGSNRFILDYLMEEVLTRQTQEVQHFLLATSVLEHLCAGLCAAITQRAANDCQQMLESLVKANLFVVSLDEERCWYRYHHLFKDLLLARFQAGFSQQMSLLCQRASEWYDQNGHLRLAVEFALKAQDIPRAADLLAINFGERWQAADLDFLFLINQIPYDVLKDRPELCLDSAGLWLTTGQYARIPPFLEAAEHGLTNPGRTPEPADAANMAFAQAIRAYLGDIQNQPVGVDASLRLAFPAIPELYYSAKHSVAMLLQAVCYMAGDFDGVMYYSQDVLERDKRLNSTVGIPVSVLRMVYVLQAQARLHQALDLIAEHEAYVRERGSRRFYVSGVLNLVWGDILLEWNRFDEAETQIRQGLRLLEDWPVPQYLALGFGILARLQINRGNLSQAQDAIRKAEALYQDGEFHPSVLHRLQKAQVDLWIAEHNLPALETFIRQMMPLSDQPLAFRIEAPLIELCRAWIALGQLDKAAALLHKLAATARDRNGRRLEVLILLTSAERNRPAAAQAALEGALRLGEPEGYLRTFLDVGEPIHQALHIWQQHALHDTPSNLRSYAGCISAAFDGPGGETRKTAYLPEPLTAREMDVLRLLAEGSSNRHIAEKLFLSEGTVKFYVHNILQKLGVKSRSQAIARAMALELLGK
jgi:LuxR family transcriptional regulator, maltose regulon positive regulatory protein